MFLTQYLDPLIASALAQLRGSTAWVELLGMSIT